MWEAWFLGWVWHPPMGCWNGVSPAICNLGGVRPWDSLRSPTPMGAAVLLLVPSCLEYMSWSGLPGVPFSTCVIPHLPVYMGLGTLKLDLALAGQAAAVCRLTTAIVALRHSTPPCPAHRSPSQKGTGPGSRPLPMSKVPACSQGLLHGKGGSPAAGAVLPSLV